MKIYTVMVFELNVLDSFEHFKDKYDAIYHLHKHIRLSENQIAELIKKEYYSDGNGYEIYFKEREI